MIKTKIALKLSQLNLALSQTETILCSKEYVKAELIECFGNFCIFCVEAKSKEKIFNWLNRLAFAKEAFIISSKNSWIDDFFVSANFLGLKIGEDSCFKIFFKQKNEDDFKENIIKSVATSVVQSKLSGKVCVKSPDLEIFLFDNYFGLRFWVNNEDFKARKVHLKKAPHPTGLDPMISRAMINLARAKKEILDPFCGGGGILEEAKLLNLDFIGLDISNKMIDRAKTNLESQENLFCMDAFSWEKKVECVVCDLPYGKSSVLRSGMDELVSRFFSHFKNITSKIVVCLPSSIDVNYYLKRNDLDCRFSFNIYIHKSLTRTILVLESFDENMV